MEAKIYNIDDPIQVTFPKEILTRTPSEHVISGSIWQITFYNSYPTFSFLDYETGGCYFDLTPEKIGCEIYSWDFIKAKSIVPQSNIPIAFKPPLKYVEIFNKDRTFKAHGIAALGLIWPDADEAFFLIQEFTETCQNNDKMILWPVHKLLFKRTMADLKKDNKLPDWKRNR